MIDAHHHLWDLDAVEYPWLMARGVRRFFGDPTPIQRNYSLEEFGADAAAQGMRGSVHIQVGAADAWDEAVWVHDQHTRSRGRWPMAQVAFCDLTGANRGESLDKLTSLSSVRGVRQILGRAPDEDAANGSNALLENPAFLEGLAELADRGLSFDLQLLPELMAATAKLLAQVPTLRVALCHAGSPHDRSPNGLAAYRDQPRTLSRLPNVYCKLSGLGMFDHAWTAASVAPIIDTALYQFGAERVMFGSNFPVCSLSASYAETFQRISANLPSAAQDAVFGKTAAAFYRLAR